MSMTRVIERPADRQAAHSSIDLDAYIAKGFAVVRGVFGADEPASWRAECDRLVRLVRQPGGLDVQTQLRAHIAGGAVLDRIEMVADASATFGQLATDDRLLALAGHVLHRRPALLKDKLIVKAPGTTGYLMHQDYPYWEPLGIPAGAITTIMLSIDAADAGNGAPELFPGLHHGKLAAPPEEPRDVDESQIDLGRGVIVPMAPGDVLLFHSLVPHRSGVNHSSRSRRALFLTYTAQEYADAYRAFHRSRDGAAP